MVDYVSDAYLESDVLSAEPVQLVCILYRAAFESVVQAREELRRGDIAARSRHISKAIDILTELSLSLNHEQGQALSHQLADLYGYMQRRLLDANFRQIDEPLAEVEGLLRTLLEAWETCPASPRVPTESLFTPEPAYEPLSCTF